MTQKDTLARLLSEHPHYSATRLAALMGITPHHLHAIARRSGHTIATRETLENALDTLAPKTRAKAMRDGRAARDG